MLSVLSIRTFRHLFAAQLVALLGTGLATVALGLLAWQLAGADAGLVLGTALAIKMIAYVMLAPLAAALAERLPRRAFLVALDLVRAVVAFPAIRHRDLAGLCPDLSVAGRVRRVHSGVSGNYPRCAA